MTFKRYDEAVGKIGLNSATRRLVEKLGERIEVDFEEGAESCLEDDSVLVVGTHPGRLNASAIVAAMPERDDSFFIGNAMLESIGPNFRKHLISVELVNRSRSAIKDLVRKTAGFTPRNIDSGAVKEKNQSSLKGAAHIVNDGGRVLIFPDNVHKRGQGNWLNGIGHLLKQLDPNTKVVFASAEPTIQPLQAFKDGNVVSTKVEFSQPISVRELLGSSGYVEVDSVVRTIEGRYREWADNNGLH